jgi:hypothetical protein
MTRQLDEAWRLDELKPMKEVVLSLDYAQHGLGNGSCGTAITMDKYQLKREKSYQFAFALEPVRSGASQVPMPKDAKASTWDRKTTQARKVFEEYQAWQKTQKSRP